MQWPPIEAQLSESLAGPEWEPVRAAAAGFSARAVLSDPLPQRQKLLEARAQLPDTVQSSQLFERYLMLQAALQGLGLIPALNLPEAVEQHLAQALLALRQPEPAVSLDHPWFPSWAALVTLQRYPAGQLDIELSGFPRSWTWRVPPADTWGLLRSLVRLGGFRPCYFTHVGLRRKSRFSLTEPEANRSYHLVAQALQRHPEVRGLISASWFHAPETFRVSPHLAWFNRVPQENGAWFTTTGPADLDSGVFERSPERRKLYDAGQFQPLTGVMIWPRRALIDWAQRHPEWAATC